MNIVEIKTVISILSVFSLGEFLRNYCVDQAFYADGTCYILNSLQSVMAKDVRKDRHTGTV